MLSSPNNPQTRYLYRTMINYDDFCPCSIKLDREIHLPEIAGDYSIGSSHGFVFSLPTRCSPDIVAINPLTAERLPLPPTSKLPPVMDLDTDFHISILLYQGITKGEQAGTFRPVATREAAGKVTVDPNYLSLYRSHIILSPSLDVAILLRKPVRGYDDAYFARLTSSSTTTTTSTWNPIPSPNINRLMDAIFHKDRLIIVDREGNIATFRDVVDPLEPQPVLIADQGETMESGTLQSYLVESPDMKDLFLVRKRLRQSHSVPFRTEHVKVFKLDNNDSTWKEVDTLGGLTFFVGTMLKVLDGLVLHAEDSSITTIPSPAVVKKQ